MSKIDFTRATTPTNTKLPKMRLMTDEKFTFTQKAVKKAVSECQDPLAVSTLVIIKKFAG